MKTESGDHVEIRVHLVHSVRAVRSIGLAIIYKGTNCMSWQPIFGNFYCRIEFDGVA